MDKITPHKFRYETQSGFILAPDKETGRRHFTLGTQVKIYEHFDFDNVQTYSDAKLERLHKALKRLETKPKEGESVRATILKEENQ